MGYLFALVFVCHLGFRDCDMHINPRGFANQAQCEEYVRAAVDRAQEGLKSQQGPDDLNFPRFYIFGFCQLKPSIRYPA